MDEIVHKLNFSLKRMAGFLLLFFLISSPISVYATDIVNEVYQEGKKATTKTLTGKVIEKGTNEPLIGASIWLKDTSVGSITDVDGNFSISVPSGKTVTLVISYIGYAKVEKEVSPSANNLVLELEPESNVLNEVQIVGYGTQRKESVIGSITSIKPAELKVPNGAISTNLAGKLGGVVSVQRSGEPGASSEFWIRGISTFGANGSPLILVDGVERSLDLLDPEEIETFSILKDATATAVYGVRGANGVILITTRRGEEGKPKISLKVESGILQPTKIPEMANSVEYAQLYNELKGYDYYKPEEIEKYRTGYDPDLYPNVDWLKTVFKEYSYNQRVTANITGGGAIARYFISGSFYHEDGIFRNDGGSYNANPDYKRYNFRSNLDINLHPTTVLSLTLGGFLEQRRKPADEKKLWNNAFQLSPNAFPIIYSNGYQSGLKEQHNPYNLVTRGGYRKEWKSILNSIISLDQDFSELITPGLKASVKFSFDTSNWNYNKYTKQDAIYYAQTRDENDNLVFGSPEITEGGPWFERNAEGDNATYLEASINYSRLFGKHRVGALVLYNQRVYNKNKTDNNSIKSLPYKNQGLAGRFTYDFDGRYFIEGNFGYNGSENFAPGHRVGFFPSGAIGWYISNEKFFEPLTKVVSKLKVKGSVGQVGNDQIRDRTNSNAEVRFIYLGTVTGSDKYVYGNFTEKGGERIGIYPNQNVSWEVSTKQNYGFELGLFNKLEIQADWYKDVRKNIFVPNQAIPYYVGLTSVPLVNIGKMKSWGFDGSAQFDQQIGKVFVSARATFTYSSNQILEYGDADNKYTYQNTKGNKIYQNRGLLALGLFESQEEIDRSPIQFSEAMHSSLRPGDIKYKDINGDGKIDDFDKIPIGYSDIPEITYGFGASLGWKGFDLSFFFQGTGRVTCFEEGATLNPFTATAPANNGFHKDVFYNHWTVERPDPQARYPRVSDTPYQSNNNTKTSSFWQRDASYIRLKNLEFGYTFPKHWMDRLGIQALRIYVSGVNLWTHAKDLHLFDPELGTTDGRKYPPTKVYNVGLNINF